MLKIKTKKQGAELTSIQCDGKEMLFDGKTFWNRQSPILFPIVGRIKDSKTEIEGQIYEMSQHGFARDMEFNQIEENHYVLTYNEETLKKYPYKFELHVIYQIIEDTLQVEYQVKNIDNKKIYFGLGGHPAFSCDYSTGQYEIVFDEKEDKIKFLNEIAKILAKVDNTMEREIYIEKIASGYNISKEAIYAEVNKLSYATAKGQKILEKSKPVISHKKVEKNKRNTV